MCGSNSSYQWNNLCKKNKKGIDAALPSCLLTASRHGHNESSPSRSCSSSLSSSTCVTLGLGDPPSPPPPPHSLFVCVLQTVPEVKTDRDQCSSGSSPCSPCPLTQAHAAFVIPTIRTNMSYVHACEIVTWYSSVYGHNGCGHWKQLLFIITG